MVEARLIDGEQERLDDLLLPDLEADLIGPSVVGLDHRVEQVLLEGEQRVGEEVQVLFDDLVIVTHKPAIVCVESHLLILVKGLLRLKNPNNLYNTLDNPQQFFLSPCPFLELLC